MEKNYKCDQCRKWFSSPIGLRKHQLNVHEHVQKRIPCTFHLHKSIWDKIAAASEATGISKQQLVINALEAYFT